MAESWLHRLKTPEERNFEIFLAMQVVDRIGWRAWESYQKAQHHSLMSCYDDYTWHLENQVPRRPNLDAELDARRLLLVELRIEHRNFMASVFNLTAGRMVTID